MANQSATAVPRNEAAKPKRSIRKDYFNLAALPYWGVHVMAIAGPIWLGFSWSGLGLALAMYAAGIFLVTAGYHRYFSHRTYKTSRVVQFVMAWLCQITIQKGVLWWGAHHRHHHKYSDEPEDVHSPVQDSFWWSHMGWILADDWKETNYDGIKDFAKYPELVWLNKMPLLPPISFAVALYFIGGAHALIWGFFVAITLLWHGTFTINSLSHVFGNRRYDTSDDSRNNPLLALITFGEGWHNNHHHYMNSTRQGFMWWEFDITYYLLRVLSVFGIVWDLHEPPEHHVRGERKRDKKRVKQPDANPSVKKAA